MFTAYAFSIWKEAYDCGGFVTLDAAPTAKRVGVYLDASGLYYVDLLDLQESSTLGAYLVEKIDGVWHIDIGLDDDVADWEDPWFSGCRRHGYETDEQLEVCPVNQFLFTEWYRMVLTDLTYRQMYSIDSGVLGLLGHMDYLVRTELMYPKRASGEWWGSTPPKFDLIETGSRLVWFPAPEKQNMETVRWAVADYSTMDALWADVDSQINAWINGYLLGMGLRAGYEALRWWANPVRNMLLQRAIERDVALMAKAGEANSEELISAALQQRLGYGYRILYGSPQATAPGNGTYGVIRYISNTGRQAFEFQCSALNCPPMQEIQGFGTKHGKFYVVLEQGLYKGSPFFDRLAFFNGQARIIDAKWRHVDVFADPAKGIVRQPDEVFSKIMKSFADQLERNVMISKEYGFGKPIIVSSNTTAMEGFKAWLQNNRPGLLAEVEIMLRPPSVGGGHWLPPVPPPDHPAIILP